MNHYEQKRERYRVLKEYAQRRLAELSEYEIGHLLIPDRAEPIVESAIDQLLGLVEQMREVLETIIEQAGLLQAVYSVPSKADAYELARQRFPKHPPYLMREYRELLEQLQHDLEIDSVVENLILREDTDNPDTENDD